MNSQNVHLSNNIEPRLWTIVLALPNARYRIIARFYNRQDADDHLRFLQRSVPQAKFSLVFNPPGVQLEQPFRD